MSRGHNPLLWMMACAVPTAGHALGLGEIHVDSALNEPLAAEIDIVGAEPEELVGLIATVANRDTFAHFGAERPAFLNNTTFKVTKDARGKPVLSIRSSESFTEPLIDFVRQFAGFAILGFEFFVLGLERIDGRRAVEIRQWGSRPYLSATCSM